MTMPELRVAFSYREAERDNPTPERIVEHRNTEDDREQIEESVAACGGNPELESNQAGDRQQSDASVVPGQEQEAGQHQLRGKRSEGHDPMQ